MAVIASPLPVSAAPPGPTSEGPEAEPAPPATSEAAEPAEPAEPPAATLEPAETPEVELEEPEAPVSGGMGTVVDPNDPNATRAQSDLEGEKLDSGTDGVPERLPKLQTAGWWTVFAGVGIATAGGVVAGIAETREDEAERLAYGFDLTTGQRSVYGDVADDYERIVREGQTYQWVARGLIIAGATVVVAGLGLFIADAVERKHGRARPSARVRFDGVALRF